ncbi:aminotransferase class V-fold PLP-dependent enzyme [Hyphococcus sp.]|uniref:aminotransferase class V-fold PLP-dependent enzyme n=1 Tax=Hyphococcus sp. TaxID=2038636 RepID=UPI002085522F|nr:MAG: class V aminotransferase [Marinicaulis sp.]
MGASKFHLPRKHYFLSHSVGAQPRTYDAAVTRAYAQPWRSEGFNVWTPWFDALDVFKAGLAPILGADANDLCPQPNVSSGVSKILFSLPERKGRNKIVLTEDDFPTVGFALDQGRRMGYELVFLPGGERLADPDAWSRAFADDVQLVVATQVYSNTSVLAPAAEIAQRAREAGVYSLVDAAQAAGAIPIKLNQWRPDFAVGTSLKYLCGGTGAAWLWADPQNAATFQPRDVGWFSHEDPFEFDIHHFDYAPGAARFTGGTPSIAPIAGASAGHEIINTHGVEAVYAHNQALLSRLFDALPASALLSTTKKGARGSAALIKVRDYEKTAAALAAAGVAHDTRKGAVRISVHLYNAEDDIDALVRAIRPHL